MRVLTLLAVLFMSTSSFAPVDEQLLPTKLRITIIDGLGNFVEGATVSIYEKKEDYLQSKNAFATLKSDDKGIVTFSDVKPMIYYVEAKKDEMNNHGEGVVTGTLAEGKINKVNTVIE